MRPVIFFFFNDTATTEIYTLSLHDALPISVVSGRGRLSVTVMAGVPEGHRDVCGDQSVSIMAQLLSRDAVETKCTQPQTADRKSTRLNSSHANISYAVFCLKKKKTKNTHNN